MAFNKLIHGQMKFNRLQFTAALLAVSCLIMAQTAELPNIKSLKIDQQSPAATIEDVAWIAGQYECEAFGGTAHEVWSEPRADNMLGMFQLIDGPSVSFYEIMSIRALDGSLMLRLKHFDKNLHGWEEKDETIDFPLVKLEKNKAYFDGLTFERVGRKRLNVYVAIKNKGETEEVLFAYKRI